MYLCKTKTPFSPSPYCLFVLAGTLSGGESPALVATVCPLGANLLSLLVPDRYGHLADITLGFDTLAGSTLVEPW